MKYITGNILDIKSGTIVHQVNCRNVIGAGLSGQIIKKYPKVESAYHWLFTKYTANELFKHWQAIPITDNLTIINLFTQFDYGNSAKTHKVYTEFRQV